MKITHLVPALALAMAVPPAGSYSDLVKRFDYDQKAPLEIRERGVQDRGGVKVHDISYASPKGGRVPAYLVVPDGKGPFPGVVWGHWYWEDSTMRNRTQFLEEAIVLARSGVVSVLTDGPVARPGHVQDRTPSTPAPSPQAHPLRSPSTSSAGSSLTPCRRVSSSAMPKAGSTPPIRPPNA